MFFESLWLNILVLIGLIIALTFDYVTKFFSYWYVRHIPYKTSVPFFGSDYHRVLGVRNTTEEVNTLYQQHPKGDFVGSVKSRIPDLVVRNPDLIKEVLCTEFESFKSRGLDLDKSRDICIRNNLFYAEGEKWTLLRERLESLLNDANVPEERILESLSGTNGNINVQHLLTKSKVLIDRKVTVNIPVEAIQNDEAHFREAEKFKPERFLNDASVNSYAFLPFGAGPRKCVGEQMALKNVRSITRAILKNYQIEPTEKTPHRLPMTDHNFGRVVDTELWLKFQPIS
ncbi:cytochrome p450 domain-containing protein [Phthorimaea operculella]|nr:cytochrome p450 domain-containing protein [Phthorimaea operculella]